MPLPRHSVSALALLTLPVVKSRPAATSTGLNRSGFGLRGRSDTGAEHPAGNDVAERPDYPHLWHPFAEPRHLAVPTQPGRRRELTPTEDEAEEAGPVAGLFSFQLPDFPGSIGEPCTSADVQTVPP